MSGEQPQQICPTCKRPFKWKPTKICFACKNPIAKGHKWRFHGDGTVRHADCDAPDSYESQP